MTIKLLIVEDSCLARSWLLAAIGETPLVRIECVEDLQTGIRRLREWRPDVAIIDVRHAGGSGLDFLEAAKREGLATRIWIFSEYPIFRMRSLAEGADRFFSKHSGLADLVDTLKQLAEALT